MRDMPKRIISREEAFENRLKRFFTGERCNKGHVSERYVTNGGCVDCTNKKHFLPRQSPFGRTVAPYVCPTLWAPAELTLEDHYALKIYMQRCIVEFAKQKALLTVEMEEAFESHLKVM